MNNDFYKHIKRQEAFIKRMTKIFTPPVNSQLAQSHSWIQQHNEIMNPDRFQDIQRQADLIIRTSKLFDNYSLAQNTANHFSVPHILEALDNQRQLMDRMNIASGHYFKNVQNWNSNISQFISSQSLNLNDLIPDSLYDSLDELTIEIENEQHFQAGSSDVSAEVTVVTPDLTHDAQTKTSMNWGSFITIVIALFALMVQIQDSYSASKQHEEKMAEMRKQTQIMEQENDILERQTDIQEQLLIEAQSQSKTNEEILESHRIINEKLDRLLQESVKCVTVDPVGQGVNESE